MGHRLLICGWHNVEPTWCYPARPGSGRRGLQRQLAWLRRAATVVPLNHAVAQLRAGRELPPRAVAITFDDGYRDNLEMAVPILEQYEMPATFFLAPDLLTATTAPWWERLGWAVAETAQDGLPWRGRQLELTPGRRFATFRAVAEELKLVDEDERQATVDGLVRRLMPGAADDAPADPLIGWAEAEELVRRGFAVGSHSRRHAVLARAPLEVQRDDLARSRAELEDRLGVPIELLAYPNGQPGDFDTHTVDAARRAGYLAAVTTITGWNDRTTSPFELRRFVMNPAWDVVWFAAAGSRHGMRALRGRLR